jgi:isopenicillin N synthase-like dioxygenase
VLTTPRIPVIDVADLFASPAALRALARRIGAAARDVGFFSIVNHGVPERLVADVFAATRAFFALPREVKESVSLERSPHYRGYARIGFEKLDPGRPGDVKESFNVGREFAPDDPGVLAGKPFHGCNQWPDLPGFRTTLLTYYDVLLDLVIALHRAVALDLGADEHTFAPDFDHALGVLRLLHYPPHPGDFDERLFGAAPHTDYGNLTLLAQDDVGGLEVRMRDGTWVAVQPEPGAFVCNIGDSLMRWSNDIYVSNPHRVVNRSARERYSVALFGDPNADATIACLPSCAGPERPAKYPPITYAELLRSKYEATYRP